MIKPLMDILGAGLSLWEAKEKRKYLDKFLKLKKEYYEESKKDQPDHAVLDDIEFNLQLLGSSFSSEVERSKAMDSSD